MEIKVLVWLVLVFSQVTLTTLAQGDIIPEGLGSLLQYPILAGFIWMTISFLKWHHEQMKLLLEAHATDRGEMSGRHHEQMKVLLETYECRLGEMSSAISSLKEMLAINTATVNEALRTEELVEGVKRLLGKERHD